MPTLELTGVFLPPQVMLGSCATHGYGSFRIRTQPDKVTNQGGMPVCPHLNHVVQRFVEQVHELAPDVEQVNLAPGNHDAGEGPLICASTLQTGASASNPRGTGAWGPSWHLQHSPKWRLGPEESHKNHQRAGAPRLQGKAESWVI